MNSIMTDDDKKNLRAEVRAMQENIKNTNQNLEKLDIRVDHGFQEMKNEMKEMKTDILKSINEGLQTKANRWVERVFWIIVTTSVIALVTAFFGLILRVNLHQ